MRKNHRRLKTITVALGLLVVATVALVIGLGWYIVENRPKDFGNGVLPAMAGYDVRHYDLAVQIFPEERTLEGRNTVTVETLADLDFFEIHLDGRLGVRSVEVDGATASFSHTDGLIAVALPEPWAPGQTHRVSIAYGGRPKVALNPPWIDGFVWSKTPTGAPWIGVTGQGDGGDNWWPCKDHPSDEPDEGMDISLTVPGDLVGLSNGRFLGEEENQDGTVTSRWRVHYPINNYLVTVNIAPYVPIVERYHGIDGELDEELTFWSTPESESHARITWKQMPGILEVLGRRFGEFPFFKDKFAVAHAPYYGMEHQTLVAYGALFTDNDYGFDDLLLHEVAHEWWGNKITVSDWADFWIQEGFATYAEAVYVLDTLGEDRYLDYMEGKRRLISNSAPLVQGDNLTSDGAYTGDIYFKGAWVLHTLRYLIGDAAIFEVILRFATDERHPYGLVSSEDLIELVSEVGGSETDWFWDRYLFRAEEPRWHLDRREGKDGDRVVLTWDDRDFEMPLPVVVEGVETRLEMTGGRGEIQVTSGAVVEVDPDGRVLASPAG